jgi:hypothetical protein
MADLEALARELYDACPTAKPEWRQIGEITKDQWRAMAQRHAAGDPEWWSIFPPQPAAPDQPQGGLF